MFDETLIKTAKTLVDYCNSDQTDKGLDELYAKDCVSIEALNMPGGPMGREANGLDAIRGKHEWWFANNDVHSSTATGPFLYAPDKFSLIFDMDVTDKASGNRVQMQEVALYTVNSEGRIAKEEFFYPPMDG